MALSLAWIMLFQAMLPLQGLALTSGPSQPEFNSFEPVSTTQMVDPFTGGFVYNIPLFELPGPDGGYPFNLSYKPDGNINAESGPFGYGWTINPGIITRDVRGIPDDHNGDEINETMSIKDNWTASADFSPNLEALGLGGLQTNFGLYYNSYRGVGVNTSAGVSLPLGDSNNGNSLGLTASFDSQEGFSVSPSIGIGGIFNASTSINSRRGMSGLSLSFTRPVKTDKIVVKEDEEGNKTKTVEKNGAVSSMQYFGAALSLNGGGNSPSLQMPWNSFSLSGKVKLGASLFGIFGNASVGGSFSRQALKNKGKEIPKDGYGYMYMENALDAMAVAENVMLDFGREKDGPINKNTPNVGIPMTSPDIFAATGQGMAGMFRPYRSDIGILHDPAVSSSGGGGSFSFDAPVLHAGGSGNVSFTSSSSGKWTNSNDLISNGFDFEINNGTDLYESYFFKTQGEKVAEPLNAIEDHIGGEGPLRADINLFKAKGNYLNKNNQVKNPNLTSRLERKPRGLVIQDFSNSEAQQIPLLNADVIDYTGGNPPNINTIDSESDLNFTNYNRHLNGDRASHIGGFISTDTKGVRYVYGIPAYNNVQEDYMFSVAKSNNSCDPLVDVSANSQDEINYEINGSDKFYKETRHAPFAHSFLLTSVLGSDYIDVDNNGPSDNDIGYWIKFNYAQIHDNFQWRSPYNRAFYDKGIVPKDGDEKGSFSYGQKEIWMVATVESKTHIAVFLTTPRQDGLAAVSRTDNGNGSPGNRDKLHRVEKIKLYTKSAWKNGEQPLRTVHFGYDYLISGNVPNSESVGQRKLTLTDLYFTSENSTRGINNKYFFDYGTDENNGGFNPNYTPVGFDRWGNYFDVNNSNCGNLDFPYTQQIPNDGESNDDFLQRLTRNNAVWNLKNITLPSGSEIKIEWEPHRYGHVQNQEATQMVEIHSLKALGSTPNNELTNELDGDDPSTVRIYFKKEPGTSAIDYVNKLQLSDRSKKIRQLYFKSRIKLFPGSNSSDKYQDVSGYLDIKDWDDDGDYAYIDVYKLKPKNNVLNYHPMSVYAWQFMKQQLPERLFALPSISPSSDESNAKGVVTALANSIMSVINFFDGFYGSCETKGFAQEIDLSNSYIKLCSPDKEKYGGGSRVAQIELHDAWEEETTYGQHYNYYDGVVANEPGLGGDENALRYAKTFPENLLLATDEVNFFEYPINENLYPGPSIGYSKVEVTSLATHKDQERRLDPTNPDYAWMPDGISTTGKVVHEFYTAKDFPVIVDETKIEKKSSKNFALLFPMGSINTELMTSSQGYSIIKNDMHGKLKKVSNFAQDVDGNFLADPYSYVSYKYKHNAITHNGKEVLALDNKVKVLDGYTPASNTDFMPQSEKLMGVDYEMINDMRMNESLSSNLGGQFNVDFLPFPPGFPLPSLWFTVGTNITKVKTAATNKMIFKSGILESVEAFDGGSTVETKNLLYDPFTGEELLTQLTNEYGNPIYNLNIPGHLTYDNIDALYDNINREHNDYIYFEPDCGRWAMNGSVSQLEFFNAGDQILATQGSNIFFGTVVEKVLGRLILDFPDPAMTAETYTIRLISADKSNNLTQKVESVSALQNPTIDLNEQSCQYEIKYLECTSTGDCVLNPKVNILLDFLNTLMANGDFYSNGVDLTQPQYAPLVSQLNQCSNLTSGTYAYDTYNFDSDPYSRLHISEPVPGQTNDHWGSVFFPESYSPYAACPEMPNVYQALDQGLISGSVFFSYNDCCFDPNNTTAILINVGNEAGILGTFYMNQFWGDFEVCQNPARLESSSDCVERTEQYDMVNYHASDLLNISASTEYDKFINAETAFANDLISINKRMNQATYSLLKDREGAPLNGDPLAVDLEHDGVIPESALFNFDNPFFDYCQPEWIRSNLNTNHFRGNNNETKDALGIYASVKNSYNNTLVGASAQNSRNQEFAFESFETYDTNGQGDIDLNQITRDNLNDTGFDFISSNGEQVTVYQSYEVYSGNLGGILLKQNEQPFTLGSGTSEVIVSGKFQDGQTFVANGNVVSFNQYPVSDNRQNLFVEFDPACSTNGALLTQNTPAKIWTGTVYVPRNYTTSGLSGSAKICKSCEPNIKAHTGSQYLSIPANSNSTLFLQSLRLVGGEQYHVSTWVARDRMHPNLPDMVTINGLPLEVTSDIINGWVRLEKTFTANSTSNFMSFNAVPLTTYSSNGTPSSVNSPLYVDDLRIQPERSSMLSYVYDSDNYRLQATLDENNYATIYEYDHEGRLTTIKKETERGLKTIQHNQSYLARQ